MTVRELEVQSGTARSNLKDKNETQRLGWRSFPPGVSLQKDSYLQQLFSRTSLLHIHLKTAVQKVPENSGQLLWVLKLWGAIGGNEVQGLPTEMKNHVGLTGALSRSQDMCLLKVGPAAGCSSIRGYTKASSVTSQGHVTMDTYLIYNFAANQTILHIATKIRSAFRKHFVRFRGVTGQRVYSFS